MNFYYITGTSRGLGKALAEYYLTEAPNNIVIGISRNQTVFHKNYEHFNVDLGDPSQVKTLHFPPHHDAKKIVLINNAGVVGMIKPMGQLTSEAIIHNFQVNLVAPAVLSNQFMKAYHDSNADKMIVNISSGAGKTPIAGWAPYCASKAGINMLSKVVDEEQKNAFGYKFRIYSIEPGVIDTQMQEEIRSASPEDFVRLTDFINYKIENQLAKPTLIAEKFAHIIRNPEQFKDVLFSVKDVVVD